MISRRDVLRYFRDDPLYPSVDRWTELIKRNTSPWKKAFLRWGSVGVPAERRTSLYSSVYGEAGKLKTPKHPVVFLRFLRAFLLNRTSEFSCNKKANAHNNKRVVHTTIISFSSIMTSMCSISAPTCQVE